MQPSPSALSPRHHRLLLALVATYVLALVVAGPHLHPVGIRGALDHYVERAEAMLNGVWIPDPYHPFLYSELVAVLTPLLGDGFAAARIVSSLAAGLLVYSGTRLAHACHGGGAAAWTMVWLLANGSIAVGGVEAGSDMAATALAVTGLWRLLQPPRGTHAITAGLCIGLAIATRYNIASLVPAILIVAWFADRVTTMQARLRRVALGTIAAVVGYLPSLIPNLMLFGSALPGQSWRNLAYKLSPTAEPSALEGAYASLAELLAARGSDLWNRTLTDFVGIWTSHLGATLAGEQAATAVAVAGTVLLAGCLVAALVRRPQQTWPALLLAVVWTSVLALTFFPQVRLLLPILPLLAGSASATCLGLSTRRWFGHTICAVVAIAIASSLWPTLRHFLASHPLLEIEAARAIAAREGPLVRIASCYPLLRRHVTARVLYVSPPGAGAMTAANLFARVRAATQHEPADYLVVSRVTTPLPSLDDLRHQAPAEFVVESGNEDVLVGRFLVRDPDWFDSVEATPADHGRLRLRLVTKIDVATAGFLVRAADGTASLLPLPNSGLRSFELTIDRPAGGAGPLELTPCAMLKSGLVVRHATLRVPDTPAADGK